NVLGKLKFQLRSWSLARSTRSDSVPKSAVVAPKRFHARAFGTFAGKKLFPRARFKKPRPHGRPPFPIGLAPCLTDVSSASLLHFKLAQSRQHARKMESHATRTDFDSRNYFPPLPI